MTKNKQNQRGGILVYILIAIFLTGLLIAGMSQGTKRSASSEQIDEVMLYMMADIQTIQAKVNECVLSYQNNNFCPPTGCVSEYGSATSGADNGNPNIPFPGPYTVANGAGASLTSMVCPRAPAAQQTIFTNNVLQSMKLLQDSSNYTVTYFNNATDGIYFRITRAVSDPLWTEALARLPSKFSSCVMTTKNTNPDATTFNCSGGCLYYFIKRPGNGPGSPVMPCP